MSPSSVHDSRCPAVLLDDGHEVDQAFLLHEVVDEVPLRAHPHLRGHLEIQTT